MPDDQEFIEVNGPLGTTAATQTASASESNTRSREREKRIADLRQQYLEETYEIDAAQVTASIIDKHLGK
jgi:anti-sigma28 factor (negative regulator of flagellin synthesis)